MPFLSLSEKSRDSEKDLRRGRTLHVAAVVQAVHKIVVLKRIKKNNIIMPWITGVLPVILPNGWVVMPQLQRDCLRDSA